MSSPLSNILLAAVLAVPAGVAQAIDYRSVAQASILFDTPSDKGKPLFIIAPGTPVEVVVVLEGWIKVRDAGGALTWIKSDALKDQRTLMISTPNAVIRQRPEETAPVAFEAVKDVVLELVTPPATGWVQVRHADGATGYVRVTEVWGL
jgi:SH3-like domain-containing protein